jgi:hypothetical protein
MLMAALLKYFMGIAVMLPAAMLVSMITIGEIFVGFAAIARAPSIETPRWNIERLKAAQDSPDIALGSLSPIIPANPGKELLGRPVYTASAKRINTRHALQLHKLPRQIYSASEEDRNDPPQSLSYAPARRSQPLLQRTPIIFGHGIY